MLITREYCFFSPGDPRPPTYTHAHRPIRTHPPTLQGFCTDADRLTLKCWWVISGVGWTTFRDSPDEESDFILVTQVRTIVRYLLILFTTQSGSCTRRPPRLFIYQVHFLHSYKDCLNCTPTCSVAMLSSCPLKVCALWRSTKEANMLCPTRFVVDATEHSTLRYSLRKGEKH